MRRKWVMIISILFLNLSGSYFVYKQDNEAESWT